MRLARSYECADRNCLPVDMSFDDYRNLVLARLEDEEYQEIEGKRINYTPIALRAEDRRWHGRGLGMMRGPTLGTHACACAVERASRCFWLGVH